MGTVFLAERADEEYQGEVAIKLIRPGMDTDFFLSRFRRERQTLARRQHPNIARLLDSGTADGLPYIVMERISGKPISVYCREEGLMIQRTLRLFLQVCAAVAHAHLNFVVHRDLKPGNILVDNSGTPKLLDFGICKLLFAGAPADATITQSSSMMTPDYASPEQVRADPVTVSSDVYSLGAVLYELLTGTRPHRIGKYTPQEVERPICEGSIERPSLAAVERSRARQLAGDLDNILLKALQKEPERRYDSVERFAEDIQRYLAMRPVSARADTLGYRFRKFVRRNRGKIVAGAFILGALAAGVVVSTREAIRAQRHFVESRQLANAIIFDVHDRVRNLPGSLPARQAIVSIGMLYLDRMAVDSKGDPELRRELAGAYQRMGEIQGDAFGSNRGQFTEALASLQKAMALLQSSPPSLEVDLDKCRLYRSIGDLQSVMQRSDDGAATYEEGIRLATSLYQEHPSNGLVMRRLAALRAGLGSFESDRERSPEALTHLNESIRLYRLYPSTHPEDLGARSAMTASVAASADQEANLGRLENAAAHYREVVAQDYDLCRAEPANLVYAGRLWRSASAGRQPARLRSVSICIRPGRTQLWAPLRHSCIRRMRRSNGTTGRFAVYREYRNQPAFSVFHRKEMERVEAAIKG